VRQARDPLLDRQAGGGSRRFEQILGVATQCRRVGHGVWLDANDSDVSRRQFRSQNPRENLLAGAGYGMPQNAADSQYGGYVRFQFELQTLLTSLVSLSALN
jgi:hypothetical protein